ncbi:MAG: hypothetical protein WKF71_09575 [Pyrinomonadaceae bacterium]
MKPNVVTKDEKKIIGIEARTSNSVEANPQTANNTSVVAEVFPS